MFAALLFQWPRKFIIQQSGFFWYHMMIIAISPCIIVLTYQAEASEDQFWYGGRRWQISGDGGSLSLNFRPTIQIMIIHYGILILRALTTMFGCGVILCEFA